MYNSLGEAWISSLVLDQEERVLELSSPLNRLSTDFSQGINGISILMPIELRDSTSSIISPSSEPPPVLSVYCAQLRYKYSIVVDAISRYHF